MFGDVGWGEILVLIIAGLFILGPERLPGAAAWLGRTIRQVKEYATGAREQLRGELGPEFDQLRKPLEDLRGIRDLNPRRMITRELFSDEVPPGVKPNGYPAGAAPWEVPLTREPPSAPPQPLIRPAQQLRPGERPPIDSDAT